MNRFFPHILLFIFFIPVKLFSQFPFTTSNVWITMDDGVQLEATIRIPLIVHPSTGLPGVVLVHGYGGDKDESYIVQLATILLSGGYASLAYSVRGQGLSGGESTTMGERERQDLLEVIEYFRATQGIDSMRIAVAGGSQGGIHSWMAAAYNMPGVRVVAPSLATPHFALDLIPNGCVKTGLYHEMTLGSVRYSADRNRVKDFIIQDLYDSVAAYVSERDLERLTDSVRIPVIQGLGWADVLFPVNAGIRATANLSSRHIPIWSYYGTDGHGEPVNAGELLFYILEAMHWFDHWLKDSSLEGASVPRVFYSDDRPDWPHHVTDVWPPAPAGNLRLYLNGEMLTAVPPTAAGSATFSIDYNSSYTPVRGWDDGYHGGPFGAAFKSTPVRYMSGTIVVSMEMTGIPSVHLMLSSSAPEYQANVRLFDVAPSDTGFVWMFVGRGTFGVRNSTSSQPAGHDFECNALSHIFPSGHRVGIELTSLDLLGPDSAFTIPYFRSTSVTAISSPADQSYIDLPLVGGGVVASIPQSPLPDEFVLQQNYPNPFNASTVISFTLPLRSAVTLNIYDVIGRLVDVPFSGVLDRGNHTFNFDGSNLSTGIYFYRLTIEGRSETRTMILLK